MTRFRREGHWRSGPYGDTHWVEAHWVERTDWDRASYSPHSQPTFVYRPRLTYESFTRPTRCSRCGADVFFVEHNGGRVFFNELCWPWDKHECGYQELHPKSICSNAVRVRTKARPRMIVEGWAPIGIERVLQEDSWFVLKCKWLEDNQLVRALAPKNPGDLRRVPAVMSKWSADGFATLSYLDDGGEPQLLIVARYSDFCLSGPETIQFPPIPNRF